MNQRFSLRLFLNLVCLICVATLCACNQAASSSGGGAEVAAKVNSVIIPLSKVDRQIEQELKQQTSQSLSELSPIALASLRMMALDRLITQEVLLQRAQKESIQVSDDDVKQRVQELIQAQGWSQEEYQKTIKELGMTEEEFRNEQRKLLLINKLVDRLKTRIPAPSEKEIADFYNQNPEQFKLGKGVYLSQIVVSPTNDGLKNDAVTEEQAKQKIATIAAQLKAGDDFATVARNYSEHQSALQSGDMGFIPEESLKGFPNGLGQRFFAMREGEVTEPIQIQGAFFIFKVTGKKLDEQELKLDNADVKRKIAEYIRQQREQVISQALMLSAMSESRIENYLAQRVLENPANFGSTRPASLNASPQPTPATEAKPAEPTKPAETAKPAETTKPAETAKPAETKPADKK